MALLAHCSAADTFEKPFSRPSFSRPPCGLRPALYSFVGLMIIAGLGSIYAGLQPKYQLADQVPNRKHTVAANHLLDAKFAGADPIDVLIQFPKDESLYSLRPSGDRGGPLPRRKASRGWQCTRGTALIAAFHCLRLPRAYPNCPQVSGINLSPYAGRLRQQQHLCLVAV